MASQHVQHMQAALDQMNIKLHHVIDDLTGVTGQAICAAILSGQRDPVQLAKLRDKRIQAPEATIAKALEGDSGVKSISLCCQRRGLSTKRSKNKSRTATKSSGTTPVSLKPAPMLSNQLK